MEKLDKGGTVEEVLEGDPSSAAYWATINAAHWPLNKEITDKDVPLLLQLLLENEVILSRKCESDQLAEGLSVLGLTYIHTLLYALLLYALLYAPQHIITWF